MGSNGMLLYRPPRTTTKKIVYKSNENVYLLSTEVDRGLSVDQNERPPTPLQPPYQSVFPSLLKSLSWQCTQPRPSENFSRLSVNRQKANIAMQNPTSTAANQNTATLNQVKPIYEFVWSSIVVDGGKTNKEPTYVGFVKEKTKITKPENDNVKPYSKAQSQTTLSKNKQKAKKKSNQEKDKCNEKGFSPNSTEICNEKLISKQQQKFSTVVDQQTDLKSNQHQRFLYTPSSGRWLRSASLSHLRPDNSEVANYKRTQYFSKTSQALGAINQSTSRPKTSRNRNGNRTRTGISRPRTAVSRVHEKPETLQAIKNKNKVKTDHMKNSNRAKNLTGEDCVFSARQESSVALELRNRKSVAAAYREPTMERFSESLNRSKTRNNLLKKTNDSKLLLQENSRVKRTENPSKTSSESGLLGSFRDSKEQVSSQIEEPTRAFTAPQKTRLQSGLKELKHRKENFGARNVDFLTAEQLVARESIEKVQKWLKTLPRHFDTIQEVLPAVRRDY